MSDNKNNTKNITERLPELGQQLGMLLMTAAAIVGMLEITDHPNKVMVGNQQPVFAYAGHSGDDQNAQRRERDETGPHYTSYSIGQRTPSRTGKQ